MKRKGWESHSLRVKQFIDNWVEKIGMFLNCVIKGTIDRQREKEREREERERERERRRERKRERERERERDEMRVLS